MKKRNKLVPLLIVAIVIGVGYFVLTQDKAIAPETDNFQIESEDGHFSINIPPDALPEGVSAKEISITQDKEAKGFTMLDENGDPIKGLKPLVYNLSPDGLKLNSPATIEIRLSGADQGIPLLYHISDEGIEALEDVNVAIDEEKDVLELSAGISHFSRIMTVTSSENELIDYHGNTQFFPYFSVRGNNPGNIPIPQVVEQNIEVTNTSGVNNWELLFENQGYKTVRKNTVDTGGMKITHLRAEGIFEGNAGPGEAFDIGGETALEKNGTSALHIRNYNCRQPGFDRIRSRFTLEFRTFTTSENLGYNQTTQLYDVPLEKDQYVHNITYNISFNPIGFTCVLAEEEDQTPDGFQEVGGAGIEIDESGNATFNGFEFSDH